MLREAMSCRGTVTHIRRGPKRHVFRYPVWMLYVPLERAGAVAGLCARWLASTDRGHLMTTEQVREKLASAGVAQVHTADLRCFALTQPRSLGFSFNPVNFYFCFAGERLAALLAHVNNTPWDERHCYVLLPRTTKPELDTHDPEWDSHARHHEWDSHARALDSHAFRFPKRFHVSPFLPMAGRYVLRLKMTADTLRIAMRFDGGDAPFSACLSLVPRPLTCAEMLRSALRRPAQGAVTLARIYWQAGRLWLKGAPFHPHPDSRRRAGEVHP